MPALVSNFTADARTVDLTVAGFRTGQYIVERFRLADTSWIEHVAYEPAESSASHSVSKTIDGVLYGEVGSRKPPASADSRMLREHARLAAANQAIRVIRAAFPYLEGEQRGPSDSKIVVDIAKTDIPAHPRTLDAKDREVRVGSLVNGGEGGAGTVVEFLEPDESHWRVAVQWPEGGEPELFDAVPVQWEGTPLYAVDIEVLA